MTRLNIFCPLVVSSLALGACAPPGQGSLGFRDIDWPRADHLMSASENREIEILLVRLGYTRGGADGQITSSTRQAIRTYQRDIGAPVTGFVSMPLLHSLRVNAPQASAPKTTYVQPVATQKAPATTARVTNPAPRRPVATPTRSPVPTTSLEGGDGGTGGAGWN